MADKKISLLPELTEGIDLANDVIPIVNNATTKKVKLQHLFSAGSNVENGTVNVSVRSPAS